MYVEGPNEKTWLGDIIQGTAHDFIFSAKCLVIICVLVWLINLKVRWIKINFIN